MSHTMMMCKLSELFLPFINYNPFFVSDKEVTTLNAHCLSIVKDFCLKEMTSSRDCETEFWVSAEYYFLAYCVKKSDSR